jgi:hypothetical protein
MGRPKIGYETGESITITKPWVVKRIIAEAQKSQTKPSTWAAEALEDFILKHRSGVYEGDRARFEAREADRTADYFF